MQPPRISGSGDRPARPIVVAAAAASLIWALCLLPEPSSCTPALSSTPTERPTDDVPAAVPEWVPRGDGGGGRGGGERGGGGGGVGEGGRGEPTGGGDMIMMHEETMKEALAGLQQRQRVLQVMTPFGGQKLEQGQLPGQGLVPREGLLPGQGLVPREGLLPGQGLVPREGLLPGQGLVPREGLLPGQGQLPGLGQGELPGQVQQGQTTGDPMLDLRHILPELNLENNTVTDVNANVGDVAHLPCRFPQLSTLHQKAFLLLQVSWIRRTDFHILTTGVYTYTTDMRFSVLHPEGSDDWTLQIKYAEERDNGTYECQMYTGTGVLSQFVNLHVNRPRAAILGPQELHVQEGDTITLVCVIQQGKPPFVFWYHGEKMVNYDGSRNRLSVMTKVEGTRTHSRLTITDARSWDSGNYSCIPPNVEPSYVIVFVTEAGDTVAAVQRRGHSSAPPILCPAFWSSASSPSTLLLLFVAVKVLLTHLLPVR